MTENKNKNKSKNIGMCEMINITEHHFYHNTLAVDEIERVLAWVDTYKLSRSTKKIARDFSDGVLLAEILYHHYPKLVEMHNYPPRNAFLMKMNNWNTLNRKVLRKLKIHLTPKIIEQLSLAVNGVIERVLISVRDKIQKDEEIAQSANREQEQSSSGGSYYEASCDDEQVLVVPVKHRVNGILELVERRVVSHESYRALKDDLSEAKEAIETLKKKVEHMESIMKLKDERIDELQKHLDRKASRRKIEDTSKSALFSDRTSKCDGVNSSSSLTTSRGSDIECQNKSSVIEVKAPTEGYDTKTPSPIDSKAPTQQSSLNEQIQSRKSSNVVKFSVTSKDDSFDVSRQSESKTETVRSDVFGVRIPTKLPVTVYHGRMQNECCDSRIGSDESSDRISKYSDDALSHVNVKQQAIMIGARASNDVNGSKASVIASPVRHLNASCELKKSYNVSEQTIQKIMKQNPVMTSVESFHSVENVSVEKGKSPSLEDFLKNEVETIAKTLDIDLKMTKEIETVDVTK